MRALKYRQGETMQLPITIDDESAETVNLTVWNEASTVYDLTETFVDGQATIDGGVVTGDLGDYSYKLTITYSDGVIDILPDISGCETCSFPKFEICEGGA